jgi:hypothetical protein
MVNYLICRSKRTDSIERTVFHLSSPSAAVESSALLPQINSNFHSNSCRCISRVTRPSVLSKRTTESLLLLNLCSHITYLRLFSQESMTHASNKGSLETVLFDATAWPAALLSIKFWFTLENCPSKRTGKSYLTCISISKHNNAVYNT